MLSIYAQSTQFITVPVSNNEGINPTSDIVQFAFLGPYSNVSQANEAVPTSSTTYYTGSWPNNIQGTPLNEYVAACLVGPGGGVVTLTTGTYLVIVKITDNSEAPVLFSGPMIVS